MPITCEDYEDWVTADAADADGTAGGPPREIAEHVVGCPTCQAARAEQSSVRALLRSESRLEPAPLGLRTRISATIDGELEHPWKLSRWLAPLGWGAAGLVAASLAFVVLRPSSGVLDATAESYLAIERGAVPAAYAASNPGDLARLYRAALRRAEDPVVVDLGPRFPVAFGALVHGESGGMARVTVYRSQAGTVVCRRLAKSEAPDLVRLLEAGPRIFEMDGLVLRGSIHGDEICILTSRMPVGRFKAEVLGEA